MLSEIGLIKGESEISTWFVKKIKIIILKANLLYIFEVHTFFSLIQLSLSQR